MQTPAKTQQNSVRVDIGSQTVAFIHSLGLVADPTAFELFFSYLTGRNTALNRDLDELIEARTISRAHVESLHRRHLAYDRNVALLAAVGRKLSTEAEVVQETLRSANRSTTEYELDLREAAQSLERQREPSLPEAIQELLRSTEQIRQTNERLLDQLIHSESQVRDLQNSIETLRVESMTDPLTGLPNRRFLEFIALEMIDRTKQEGEKFSLVLLDVDGFKGFNDCHGHLIGDDVLRLVAVTLRDNVRSTDTVARFGGDEFAIVLRKAALGDALRIGETIRKKVAERPITRRSNNENLGRVTVSLGVAEHEPGDTLDVLFGRADANLYRAKSNGRNCAVG